MIFRWLTGPFSVYDIYEMWVYCLFSLSCPSHRFVSCRIWLKWRLSMHWWRAWRAKAGVLFFKRCLKWWNQPFTVLLRCACFTSLLGFRNSSRQRRRFFPFSHNISSFFCSRPYYYAVSRKIFFRISFGFSRCCCMFLYTTFWNLYKTEYFLYKNRRKFRHVFSGFPWFLYSYSGFFWGRSPSFWVKESGFLIYLSVF